MICVPVARIFVLLWRGSTHTGQRRHNALATLMLSLKKNQKRLSSVDLYLFFFTKIPTPKQSDSVADPR
jgi:hypothetical protein